MSGAGQPKRLVVVADDFGRSRAVNEAILEACDRGIVTSTSLMAGGEAFAEAAAAARARPALAVGLHATLCDGRAVLPPERLADLVDARGLFEPDPARAGFRYGARWRRARPQIEAEIAAQFDRLAEAGVSPSHVDGHHHLHIHPLIFPVLCREAARRGARSIRIPCGDLRDVRAGEALAFTVLGLLNRRMAARWGLLKARGARGRTRSGGIDETWLAGHLRRMPGGWNEIIVHPDLATEAGRRELRALTSPQVRDAIAASGITLASYAEPGGGDRLGV